MAGQLINMLNNFQNDFIQCVENMDNNDRKTIHLSTIKDLFTKCNNECLLYIKNNIKNSKTTRNISPLQNFIKETFRSFDKSDKQNCDLEGLQGYRKFEKIIKYLYSKGKITFDSNIDINKICKTNVPNEFKFNPNNINVYNSNSDSDSDSDSENELSYKSTHESDNEITHNQPYTSEDEYNNNSITNDNSENENENENENKPPPTKSKKSKKKTKKK